VQISLHPIETIDRLGLYKELDSGPQVRLHGDLILENVLVPDREEEDSGRPFLFIDPVSVAGVTAGHPACDLVKYESYATGLLFSIRSGTTIGIAITPGTKEFELNSGASTKAMHHFRSANLGPGFRASYTERYGSPNPDLLNLLDGYFSLAMAINTSGQQPLTRALMAAKSFAAIK